MMPRRRALHLGEGARCCSFKDLHPSPTINEHFFNDELQRRLEDLRAMHQALTSNNIATLFSSPSVHGHTLHCINHWVKVFEGMQRRCLMDIGIILVPVLRLVVAVQLQMRIRMVHQNKVHLSMIWCSTLATVPRTSPAYATKATRLTTITNLPLRIYPQPEVLLTMVV